MLKKIIIPAILCAIVSFGSCIYQNSPLQPNQTPVVTYFAPEAVQFSLTVADSVTFVLKGTDPDGDQLKYTFFVNDTLRGTTDRFIFRPRIPGQFRVLGAVCDSDRKALCEWLVTVNEKDNKPPNITWAFPEQSGVSCAVGDTLTFHFHADDDHPDRLQLSYLLNGRLLRSGSSDLIERFMERGEFVLAGVAYDGQYGDTVTWNVSVAGFPDTIPPAAILDLKGGPGERDGEIRLEWTAPGDDGTDGRASAYMVRTSTYPILTEKDWKGASSKPGEPLPSAAGQSESMVIQNLVSASYVYVTVRAADDFFNISPLGNCARILVRGIDVRGRAYDAVNARPLAGIYVSNGGMKDTTSADGSYELLNIPSYTTRLTAQDEFTSDLGGYYDISTPFTKAGQSMTADFPMVPVRGLGDAIQPDWYQGRFWLFFRDMTETLGDMGSSTVYKGWNHWPITIFNPPMRYKGLDLQDQVRIAMQAWEDSTGLDLFTETTSFEAADAVIIYDSTTANRHSVGTTAYNDDGTPKRKDITICFLDTEAPIEVIPHAILAHELGHILGLGHSRNAGHLLVGFTLPYVRHVTSDEAAAMKVLRRFPTTYDFKSLLEQ